MMAAPSRGAHPVAFFQALGLLLALSSGAFAADLTGRWTLELDPDFGGNQARLSCDVTQEGQQLTLECEGASVPFAGTVDERVVKFVVMTGEENLLPARFVGNLDANDAGVAGTWRLEDTTGNRIGRFQLRRAR